MEDGVLIFETLINKKAELEKECDHLYVEYIRKFGDILNKLFEKKIEAITLKKKIAFCVKKNYLSETIYSDEVDNYIDQEIEDYRNKLKEQIAFKESVDKTSYISFDEVRKIKKLFYKIVHLIHPDMHPTYKNKEKVEELWNEAVNFYKRNMYEELVLCYDEIMLEIVDDLNEIKIDNIEKKIIKLKEDIECIKKEAPYTYKLLLDDVKESNAYKEKIIGEIKEYGDYIKLLKKELEQFKIVKRYTA